MSLNITENIPLDLTQQEITSLHKEVNNLEKLITFRRKELAAISIYNFLIEEEYLHNKNIGLYFMSDSDGGGVIFCCMISNPKYDEKDDFSNEENEIVSIANFSENEIYTYIDSDVDSIDFINNDIERNLLFKLIIGSDYEQWLKEKKSIKLYKELDEKLKIKPETTKKNKM